MLFFCAWAWHALRPRAVDVAASFGFGHPARMTLLRSALMQRFPSEISPESVTYSRVDPRMLGFPEIGPWRFALWPRFRSGDWETVIVDARLHTVVSLPGWTLNSSWIFALPKPGSLLIVDNVPGGWMILRHDVGVLRLIALVECRDLDSMDPQQVLDASWKRDTSGNPIFVLDSFATNRRVVRVFELDVDSLDVRAQAKGEQIRVLRAPVDLRVPPGTPPEKMLDRIWPDRWKPTRRGSAY